MSCSSHAEVLCAHFVQTQTGEGAATVYEIGCGLGLLSTLLALRGVDWPSAWNETALAWRRLNGSPRRVGAAGESDLRWVRGSFPKALRGESGVGFQRGALVTNLLGSAYSGTAECPSSAGSADFGAVVHRYSAIL